LTLDQLAGSYRDLGLLPAIPRVQMGRVVVWKYIAMTMP
jgi:hypothetical protein